MTIARLFEKSGLQTKSDIFAALAFSNESAKQDTTRFLRFFPIQNHEFRMKMPSNEHSRLKLFYSNSFDVSHHVRIKIRVYQMQGLFRK